MSSCNKTLLCLAVLCLFGLSACGFQPVYGSRGTAGKVSSAQYAGIEVAVIPDRDGQYLRNLLIDRLYTAGRPADARYLLRIDALHTDTSNIGIRKDATYTRALLTVTAKMTLLDRHNNGAAALTRELRAVGSYNLLDNQFATLVSRNSLTDNLLQELADSAVTALNLHLAETAP